MVWTSYQTTGRGFVASGFLVPNVEAVIDHLAALVPADAASRERKQAALEILDQLRRFAILQDRTDEGIGR